MASWRHNPCLYTAPLRTQVPYDGWAAPQVVVSVAHRGERLPLPRPRPPPRPLDPGAVPAAEAPTKAAGVWDGAAGGGGGGAAAVTSDCPFEFPRLIEACWAQDPSQRPSFAEIERAIEEMPL